VGVRVGRDAGDDPHQDVLGVASGNRCLEPVDVVGVVDDDQSDAVLDRQGDLLVALGVAVQDDQPRVDTGLHRGEDLAAPGHVESEPLLDHHPLDGGAGEGLGREDHP
jgi:hypothetical protein